MRFSAPVSGGLPLFLRRPALFSPLALYYREPGDRLSKGDPICSPGLGFAEKALQSAAFHRLLTPPAGGTGNYLTPRAAHLFPEVDAIIWLVFALHEMIVPHPRALRGATGKYRARKRN